MSMQDRPSSERPTCMITPGSKRASGMRSSQKVSSQRESRSFSNGGSSRSFLWLSRSEAPLCTQTPSTPPLSGWPGGWTMPRPRNGCSWLSPPSSARSFCVTMPNCGMRRISTKPVRADVARCRPA
eukprot:7384343-Prymnesium_polylepis.2